MATTSDLINYLSLAGIARPAALRAELGGVSAQTLSRLVSDAGDNVYRFGQGRATQYARTRTVEGLGRALPVFRVSDAGEVMSAGTLRLLWRDRTFWERAAGGGDLFEGLPPALVDMAPQGYLGRGFAARFPELQLPHRIQDWSENHGLIALARRGEDTAGDLILGNESLQRFLQHQPVEISRDQFPELARRSATDPAGSSAGGERPKFGVFSDGRHVLVKFAPAASGPARRWHDLLWCEWKALETVAAAGRPSSRSRVLDVGEWRFLEVERFDRVGSRGRRSVLSLYAINNEHLGQPDTWVAAAPLLRQRFALSETDATHLRWLDVFGQLIGNTDRHFGNICFFVGPDDALRLAPAYDMLPMILAPEADVLVTREFVPFAPTGSTLDVWHDAASWARRYWREVTDNPDLSPEIREYAERAGTAISELAARVAPVRVAAEIGSGGRRSTASAPSS